MPSLPSGGSKSGLFLQCKLYNSKHVPYMYRVISTHPKSLEPFSGLHHIKWKRIRFEFTPYRHIPQSHKWFTSLASSFIAPISECYKTFHHWYVHWHISGPDELEGWPMTLTYKLDLDILPLDLNAKIQVFMSVRSAGTSKQTDTQITWCQNYYTRHVTNVGCNNGIVM